MSMAKYILNLEEMAAALSGLEITPGLTAADLSKLERLLEDNLKAIRDMLAQFGGEGRRYGSADMSLHIPAVSLSFERTRTFQTDVLLTGMTFSQSAWKVEDAVSLHVGNTILIDHIRTKELGERREFPAWQSVKAGTEIKIIYDNISGNSKMFFCDLDYIAVEPR